MEAIARSTKRIVIGILGGLVVLFGLVLVPYPGPGWLTVFAGLAILATEFDWAKRLLGWGRAIYKSWEEWLRNQSFIIRAVFWFATAIVIIATIWLLNGYGLVNTWLELGVSWLKSPLSIF